MDSTRLVGADRVLAVLVELSRHGDGIGLDELARTVASPKSSVHRALSSLRRAGLASQDGRGRYVLGDEFLRMAFAFHEARPDHVRVRPALAALVDRFGETAHYAVLDGPDVVYRAKVDPSEGAVRLSSVVGGRNPAHSTAVGKLLLSYRLPDLDAVRAWAGVWAGDQPLRRRTPKTATTAEELHAALEEVRAHGYAVDDQEDEVGVNCLAVPVFLTSPAEPSGAVSVSALTYRTAVPDLVAAVPEIRRIVTRT
jgi:IclR family transcriptional regulator, acetate operon repressor